MQEWLVWWPELAVGGEEGQSWARHSEGLLVDKVLITLACMYCTIVLIGEEGR